MARSYAPAIDHPYVFSVSQINTFLDCERKWAFQKIDGIPEPTTDAQQIGLDVHGMLEDYLKRGKPINTDTEAGAIAMSGHHYLPVPMRPHMRVEEWFSLEFGVAAYRGLMDIAIFDPKCVPQVKDHKTTSNFNWMKTEKDLKNDIQAGIYSAAAMLETGSNQVECEWIYYRTKGARKAQNVKAVIREEDVQPILHRVDEAAKRMITVLKTVSTGIEAEPNYASCEKYGGCPHRGVRCKVPASGVLKAIVRQKMEEESRATKTAGFMAQLAARKSGDKTKKNGIEVKEVDKKPAKAEQINSEERSTAKIPEPPKPKKVGDRWVQATWDEDRWEYVFPVEDISAAKEEVKQKKMAEKKPAGKQAKGMLDRFKAGRKSRPPKSEKPAPKAAPEPVAASSDAVESSPAEAPTLESTLEPLLDLIADRVAKKLRSRE